MSDKQLLQVNKSTENVNKLEQIMVELGNMARKANADDKNQQARSETLGDDAALREAKRKQISEQEALVRPVLALFGINYDSLIAMDGKSFYSQAVKARPDILPAMLASDLPVLAALKVAMAYKPYAEFGEKYGQNPDEIIAKLKAEGRDEALLNGHKKALDTVQPMFAQVSGQRDVGQRYGGDLKDVFGR